SRKKMRRLSEIGCARTERVLRTHSEVDLFLPVPVHVAKEEILHTVDGLFPALIGGRHSLAAVVTQRLSVRANRETNQECSGGDHRANVSLHRRSLACSVRHVATLESAWIGSV